MAGHKPSHNMESYYDDRAMKEKMGEAQSTDEESRNACKMFVGKPKGNVGGGGLKRR
jgi:hypothetical protein